MSSCVDNAKVRNAIQTQRSRHSQECKNPRPSCFCASWPRLLIFSPHINGFLLPDSWWNISWWS